MKSEHKTFYREVIAELETGSLAVFAGAGLSVSAGHVNWKQLLKDITEDLGLDYNKETDLIAVAQYNTNKTGNRATINRKIIEEFNRDVKSTKNHEILSRLPIYSFWTTNYDDLIESALANAGRIPDTKHTVKQLPYSKPKRDAIVYKMHGDATLPNEAVITKDDYERYSTDKQPFLTMLNSELISKLFVFIGFSFTDPNLDYVLSRVRINMRGVDRNHYHFIKRISKDDYDVDTIANFEFDKKKQELFVDDLKRFGLQAVYVDTYGEITEILEEIENIFKRKTVFISGSAEQYGDWNSQDGQGFIHKLSAGLVGKGLRVVNGFGWGVGSAVINGALSKIYEHPDRFSKDQLIIKPFPQFPTGGKTLAELWSEYRDTMISYAGVSIIIFGNKKDNSDSTKIIDADGVYKEFQIAKTKNLFVIPIPATGSMATKIFDELEKEDFGRKSKDSIVELMMKLKTEKDGDKIIKLVNDIIEKLNA